MRYSTLVVGGNDASKKKASEAKSEKFNDDFHLPSFG